MIKKVILSENSPNLMEIYDFLSEDVSGANFIFFGRVKEEINGKKVKYMKIEIDAFYAEEKIMEFLKKYDKTLNRIYYYHRLKKALPGDELLVFGVSSDERFSGHSAALEIINFTKELFKHSEKDILY